MISTPSDDSCYLVTGALGCIGAWTTRLLLRSGAKVVALDAGTDDHRLNAALLDTPANRLERVVGDVTDLGQITRIIEQHQVDAIIHLAALQVPTCQANPVLGAQVNVVGQLVMLDAARSLKSRRPLVYASSVGAYAPVGGEQGLADPPATFYGVYKRAGEQAAALYAENFGVASIGIRPHTVYGPGRDVGVSAQPTYAVLAAADGRPYHMPYGGNVQLQFVEDVAQSFVNASRSDFKESCVVDLVGHSVTMSDVIDAITAAVPESRGTITFDDVQLPFPTGLGTGPSPFPRPADRSIADGMRATVSHARTQKVHRETQAGSLAQ
jgi:UDP-glucuronate 4-epimerase